MYRIYRVPSNLKKMNRTIKMGYLFLKLFQGWPLQREGSYSSTQDPFGESCYLLSKIMESAPGWRHWFLTIWINPIRQINHLDKVPPFRRQIHLSHAFEMGHLINCNVTMFFSFLENMTLMKLLRSWHVILLGRPAFLSPKKSITFPFPSHLFFSFDWCSGPKNAFLYFGIVHAFSEALLPAVWLTSMSA